jgi:hypothetical protein
MRWQLTGLVGSPPQPTHIHQLCATDKLLCYCELKNLFAVRSENRERLHYSFVNEQEIDSLLSSGRESEGGGLE